MNQYKYYVKGTVSVSRNYHNYRETMENWEIRDYLDEIEALFDGNSVDELAQYIHEDDDLIYGVVTEIWVGVKMFDGEVFSFTEITTKELLSDEQKEQLLDYLSGQFSDGYGEVLEQQNFCEGTEIEESEEWDEEEQEYYTEEYEVNTYMNLHLWTPELELEFINYIPVHEIREGKVKPRCKLMGEDGNVFNLIGLASTALKNAGMSKEAKEMTNRILASNSYGEALCIMEEYVRIW